MIDTVFHNIDLEETSSKCFKCAMSKPQPIMEDSQYQPEDNDFIEEEEKSMIEELYDKDSYKLILIDFIRNSNKGAGDVIKYIKAVLKV